jgi:hypothetical protein
MKKLFYIAVICITAGCSDETPVMDRDKGAFYFTLEELPYWSHEGNIDLFNGRNESACIKVDDSHEFTPTFKIPLSSTSVLNPKRVVVKGWFMVKDLKSTAKLVTCIHHNGENIFWNAASTESIALKTEVWTKIEAVLEITKPVAPEAQVVIYGLRTGSGVVFFDDLEINLEN